MRQAVIQAIENQRRRDALRWRKHPESISKLWPSDLQGCPRKAILRVLGYEPTHEFSLSAQESMQAGVVWEAETLRALQEVLGINRVTPQLYLSNRYWSGLADFVIDLGSKHPVIVEHKAQSSKWWNYRGCIPREGDLLQLWLYGQLYEEIYRQRPTLILYYRGWTNWAELNVYPDEGCINVSGFIDDQAMERTFEIDAPTLRTQAEALYTQAITEGSIPDRYSIEKEGLGFCRFKDQPCTYYGWCWPEQKI